MRILIQIITGLTIVKLIECTTIVTDDSIIIEADPHRSKRSWYEVEPRATWQEALGEGNPCLTSKGHLGFCASFRQCYPYFKVPDLSVWESWVLGNYDTCSYFNKEGRQAFGVCCTNPITPSPPTVISESEEVAEEEEQEENLINLPQPSMNNNNNPHKNNNYPSWPPPVPTHPPDHTAATHPTHLGAPTTQATASKPTKKPSTTWPTKSTARPSTTKYPGWPPQPVTHPSTMRPITTTSSSSVITEGDTIPVDGSCGAKNGNVDQERIVGGHNADPNEWPWVVALFNNGRQFCGGSLIDRTHILTAAHCVAHMSSWDLPKLMVKLGDHNIRSNTEVKHVERKVKRLVRHRGFDSRTLYNDVAVLTMDMPVKYTKAVRPICLPAGDGSRLYNGLSATVIGWGSLRENGPQPAILQEVSLPIWSNAECKRKYGHAAPGGIIESMLCAGQAAKDSCSGDSGGPLMVNDGRWTQVGVVSWGIGCGKGQYPGVYTRVTSFIPWISKNTKD